MDSSPAITARRVRTRRAVFFVNILIRGRETWFEISASRSDLSFDLFRMRCTPLLLVACAAYNAVISSTPLETRSDQLNDSSCVV